MALTNSQYDAVMRAYDRRRTENRRIQEDRVREAYEAIPALSEVDRARACVSLSRAASSMGGESEEEILKRMSCDRTVFEAVRKHGADPIRQALLKKHGYPEDYLEPVYTCPDCRDTGYANGERCHCFSAEVISLFYSQSELGPVLERENFKTLSLEYYPEKMIDDKTGESARDIMEKAADTCKSFAEHLKDGGQFLLLNGETGLGKTFLAHCIAKKALDDGHSVIFFSASDLFERLAKSRFSDTGEAAEQAIDQEYLAGCELLIIDDLGTELTNAFTSSAFFNLLNSRLTAGQSMVISTNLTMSEMNQLYSERICSRIMESFTIVTLFGKDIRILKRIGV